MRFFEGRQPRLTHVPPVCVPRSSRGLAKFLRPQRRGKRGGAGAKDNQVIVGLFHKLLWQVTGERQLNSRLAPADILLLVHWRMLRSLARPDKRSLF